MQNLKRLVIIALITLSFGLNIFLAALLVLSNLQLKEARGQITGEKTDQQILDFAKLFVDKFLLGQGTIDFEDRLKLENSVRSINDPEIFKQWQNFTNSSGDEAAQVAAGKLFNLLLDRLKK